MPERDDDATREPTYEEIEASEGPMLLEFGATWCPHCQALAPGLFKILQDYPQVRHVRIEDGPGRRLGRSFKVKLWPNLVFLRDGQVVKQFARPLLSEVREGLEAIAR